MTVSMLSYGLVGVHKNYFHKENIDIRMQMDHFWVIINLKFSENA